MRINSHEHRKHAFENYINLMYSKRSREAVAESVGAVYLKGV